MAGAVPVLQHLAGRGIQYDKVELRRDSQPELLDHAKSSGDVSLHDHRGGLEPVYARLVSLSPSRLVPC